MLLLLLGFVLGLPVVQTKLGSYATNYLQETFDVDIVIGKVDLTFFGKASFDEVLLRDHHQDTMIYAGKIRTSIFSYQNVTKGKVYLGDIAIEGVDFRIKTYEKEDDNAFNLFVKKFEKEPKDSIPSGFELSSSHILLKNGKFGVYDENADTYIKTELRNINGLASDLKVDGPNFSVNARGLSFIDDHNIDVTNFYTDFSYTRQQMMFSRSMLETKTSEVHTDIVFYRDSSFADFTNRVPLNADFYDSKVSLDDLNKLYNELGGEDVLSFEGSLTGVLNDFEVDGLKMTSQNGLELEGDFQVKHAATQRNLFSLKSDITSLKTNYYQVYDLMPDNFAEKLPGFFEPLGNFEISGTSYVDSHEIDAQIQMYSVYGAAISLINVSDIENIEEAKYEGHLKVIDLDFGKLIGNPKIGQTSLDADIYGKGFKLENIVVNLDGNVYKFQYQDYNYNKIKVKGELANNRFNGSLISNDDHMKFDFIGLADLSKEVNEFNFDLLIDYGDLSKTNIYTKDSISIVKGKIDIELKGNSIEDMEGDIKIENASYSNSVDEYQFKDFYILSDFNEEGRRKIQIESTDLVTGKIVGDFKFRDFSKLVQNALGSVYSNYKPHEIKSDQYVKFNFEIFGGVIEALYPQVKVGDSTLLSGTLNSNSNQLKLDFKTPKLELYGGEFNNIKLHLNNKNPLYNTQLIIDSVRYRNQKISEVNLVNNTINDTLFVRTRFTEGPYQRNVFNFGLYHTINEKGQSVLGFNKSDIFYKNSTWYLNPNEQKNNKFIIDFKDEIVTLESLDLLSYYQKIRLHDLYIDQNQKQFILDFNNVNLAGITPDMGEWSIAGMIDGDIDYKEKDDKVYPTVNLSIEDFFINESYQGDLDVSMVGNNSIKKFDLDVAIGNIDVDNVAGTGSVDLSPEQPLIDLDVAFEDYKLDFLKPLGNQNFSNIRGTTSGKVHLDGELFNPNMDGVLYFENAGLGFPYLNVDYSFVGKSKVILKNQTFEIEQLKMSDEVHNTSGLLSGIVRHEYFKRWYLDLDINTKNLLVLNTEKDEESLYYGQGYIDGEGKIYGYTDNLKIDVRGKTNPGTYFVVPLSDIKSVEDSDLITFTTQYDDEKEKEKVNLSEELLLERFKGLSLEFNLEVTKDATVEMVLDQETGSILQGNGTGNLLIEIDTNGEFDMYGTITIDKGYYDYKLAGLATKRFNAVRGGTIAWGGNPFTAELDIETIHRVYANPKMILENTPTNRDIPVDLIARFSGELYDSKQDFTVTIPNADSDVKSELEFKIKQNNNEMMHFGSLLLFGNFYNDQSNLFQNSRGLGAETAYQLLSSTISSIINAGNDNFKLGVNYKGAGNNPEDVELQTDDQVEVSVATKINDRILVDGSVGVPVGANKQTTLVGEAKVELLLNEEGTLRSSVFNRQNEIQYNDEEEGYTQGVGISYQLDFENFSEFLEKIGLKKKTEDDVNTDKLTSSPKESNDEVPDEQ